ncbi:MAG: Fic family protein [Spirochaetaceae bacterium]|jgi:fido (protein-threonine AMPylation protein)|nr:Fic family protein [Spirochaetaceae bacterium]
MTDFEEYIRQGEPSQKEKAQNWRTAIGLQQVDGLVPSAYLIETAKQNIEGDITIDEVKSRIDAYYKQQTGRNNDDGERTEEADKVSSRIAEILGEKTFSFTPLEYINIHRRLFSDIYKFAGKIRDYNITKDEWVLDGQTVLYSDYEMIKDTLEYDFREEKDFNYKSLTKQEQVEHIAKFISGLWQIHAFGEGNTRTTAVFAIKYLRSFGFDIENEPFAQYSWYFRNALVRANYNDWQNNIHATQKFLMLFFGNIIFGENNDLKNREMHIKYGEYLKQQSIEKLGANVGVNADVGVNVGVKNAILSNLKENPNLTIQELAIKVNKTTRTIERNIKELREKGIITRVGSDKTGHWQISEEADG